MRVDLGLPNLSELGRSDGPSKPANITAARDIASGANEDTAALSTGSDEVKSLAKQLASAPYVRQQRVEALRQSLTAGTFELSPSRIAEAMMSDAQHRLS